MNILIRSEQAAHILDDDEAIKKANSVQWFDNQAGAVEWMKPKKKRVTPIRTNADLNEMSFEELGDLYTSMFEKLHVLNSLPSELRIEQRENVQKTIGFTVAIKIAMRKKANPEQSAFLNDYEQMRKKVAKSSGIQDRDSAEQIEQMKSIIAGLQRKATQLTKELEDARAAKSKTLKIERMRLANDRENMIHFYFKKIVKDEIGESHYLELINKADELADARLEEIKKENKGVEHELI